MRTGAKENQVLLDKLSVVSSKSLSFKQALAEYRMVSLSNRICALEEALQVESSEDHPLLSPELLAIKQGVNIRLEVPGEAHNLNMGPKAGTLSVNDEMGIRFLGASAAEVG